MELGYEIQLEQKQQLTQSQIQSLEILAMDGVELNQFLQNEYLENPLLDVSGTHSMGSGQEEINKTYEQTLTYGRNYEEMIEEEDKRRQDIPMQDQDQVRNFLLDQLPGNRFGKEQWELLEYMVDCLDDTGFFTIPVQEVADRTRRPVGEVRHALDLLQGLEPYGIFAADLRQCLLKQLEMCKVQDSVLWKVVDAHLQDVADGKISNISRSLKISTAEVRRCIEQIARLNPRPMSEFRAGKTDYIVPDIIFHEENGKWEVELNDAWVEDYHVNDYYLRMMKESQDEELTEYFRMKLERVRFVMNSIAQRRQTMKNIARTILRRQQSYLEGRSWLLPMTMTDVAGEIGIHTSTVSRAIKGKYIQYPRGTVAMKALFSASVATSGGAEMVGIMQVKEMIRELIDREDKRKPLSDQAIVNALKEKHIDVSRRGVAKYRDELGIRGSFSRRAME